MRTTVLLLATLVGIGCSGSGNSGAVPLSACVNGWYLAPPSLTCACGGSNAPSECGASDCAQWLFEGFAAGQTYYAGTLYYSPSSGTTSGHLTTSTLSLTNDGYQIGGGQAVVVSSCTSSEKVADGSKTIRPPAGLVAALNQVIAGNMTSWAKLATQ